MKPHPHLFRPIILFAYFRLHIVSFFCIEFKNTAFFFFWQSPLHKCILHAVKLRTMDEHIAVHINASVNEKTEREGEQISGAWLPPPIHVIPLSMYPSPMEKIRDKKNNNKKLTKSLLLIVKSSLIRMRQTLTDKHHSLSPIPNWLHKDWSHFLSSVS